MKTNKNIIICALLLITMISIVGAVSASEATNDDLSITDTTNNHVSASDSQNSLADKSTADITSSSDNDKQTKADSENIDKPVTSTKKVEEDKLTAGEQRTVTNTTISDFFTATGLTDTVKENDELIFDGEFKDQKFTINKTVTLTGKNAIMNNTAFIIAANNVKISNFTFIADKIFDNNAVIYSTFENTTITDNNITYDAPNTGDSYAIYLNCADGSQLIGNNINYTGKLNSTANIITMGIYSTYSDNLTVKDNNITATIPSVAVGYDAYWNPTVLSAGVILDNGNNTLFQNNNVKVKYEGNDSSTYDSTYAVKLSKSDNAKIIENNIELNGHRYTYALFTDGKNLNIKNNTITTKSDDLGAYGIQIDSHSTANIENNTINTTSNGITYGIYSEGYDWKDPETTNTITINNNTVNVESNTAYGIMADLTNATIKNNKISSKGNYSLGIGIILEEAKIENNNITAIGTNTGASADTAPMIKPIQTVGIATRSTEATITNNNITSNGDYGIDTIRSTVTLKDNTLNGSQGIKCYVTPETITDFFDNGVLKDIQLTTLVFDGTFKDLTLSITKSIELIGNVALFNNTALQIIADNVNVTNIQFIADKIFDKNVLIYSEGINTTLKNNNITYDAPNTGDSYAIYLNCADGSQLIGNNINYTGKLNSTANIITMGIYSFDSDNLTIKNNKIDITIPSLDVSYGPAPYYIPTVLTEGILLENSQNATFEDNNITVNYNEASGFYDTIRAVQITGADNAQINKNNITINGHKYTYGLTLDGKKMTITNNNINSNSDNYYAAGLEIDRDSTATIENNNINTKAPGVTYGIYADDWGMGSTLIIDENNVTAESNTAYGMIINSKNSIINENNITTKANYTTGLGFKNGASIINNNTINATGSNKGTTLDTNPMVPIQTTGIYLLDSTATIENNTINTTGDSVINAANSDLTLKNNNLTTTGNNTLNATNCIVALEAETFTIPNTEKINKEIAEDKTQIANLTEENKKLAKEKDDANNKVNTLTSENNQLKSDLNTANQKASDANANANAKIKKVKAASKVKKSKNFKVTVTLSSTKVNGKYVYIIFNGKSYKAKAKKGVAKITIKKSALKKLGGKKVKYQVVYDQSLKNKSVKVKK